MPARSLTAIDARNSRWGRITIERSARTGAVNYRQGGYYQSRADRNGVSLLTYIHAMFGLIRQRRAQSALLIGCALRTPDATDKNSMLPWKCFNSLVTPVTPFAPC